jgi:uncharacterized protein YcnI
MMREVLGVQIVAAAVLAVGVFAGAGIASAHVRVDADHPWKGNYAVLTFRVPNESEKGALTTQLSVALPNVTSASTEVMPGWTATLDRDTAAGNVRSVSWSAAPGGGISPDQFALFRISVKLPDSESLTLPATQTYSDGTVVRWDQAPLPGGGEPEYPAPTIALSAQPATGAHSAAPAPAPTTDNAARWMSVSALVIAAAGVALAAFAIRRRQS